MDEDIGPFFGRAVVGPSAVAAIDGMLSDDNDESSAGNASDIDDDMPLDEEEQQDQDRMREGESKVSEADARRLRSYPDIDQLITSARNGSGTKDRKFTLTRGTWDKAQVRMLGRPTSTMSVSGRTSNGGVVSTEYAPKTREDVESTVRATCTTDSDTDREHFTLDDQAAFLFGSTADAMADVWRAHPETEGDDVDLLELFLLMLRPHAKHYKACIDKYCEAKNLKKTHTMDELDMFGIFIFEAHMRTYGGVSATELFKDASESALTGSQPKYANRHSYGLTTTHEKYKLYKDAHAWCFTADRGSIEMVYGWAGKSFCGGRCPLRCFSAEWYQCIR